VKVAACGLIMYLVSSFSNWLNSIEIFLKQRTSVSFSVSSNPLKRKTI